MITPKNIKIFLKKHNVTKTKLCRLAGVNRWSLWRFLYYKDADITLKTARKLKDVMETFDNR